jgi:hypothetical protein
MVLDTIFKAVLFVLKRKSVVALKITRTDVAANAS